MSLAAAALALLGLNLYISVLAYTLRAYSRARLSDRLTSDKQRAWLDWLDRYENQLQVIASLGRLTCNLLIVVLAIAWYRLQVADGPVFPWIWPPALGALLLLALVNIGVSHALSVHAGEDVLARSFAVLAAARAALFPVVRLMEGVEFVVRRLLGRPESTPEEENERAEEEILDAVSEGKALGAVDEEQEDMIEAIFELHDTTVSAIMTPRTDIVAIESNATIEQVREVAVTAGHSRIPVIEESLDQIVGVLYVKDLVRLRGDDEFDVGKMMRPVPYVPEAKPLDQLLREMRQRRVHIAIVLDEYGGTAGLVTFEDILEELVGEIDDEYDKSTPEPIQRIDADTLDVDARVHVSEINEELEVEIPEDGDYETLGGFVFTQLGKIPAVGEEVLFGNLLIQVVSAEPRKINRLRVRVSREERQTA